MEAVFKREFKSYFINMTGYVFIGILWLFCGIFTMAINLLSQYASFEYVLGNQTIVLMLVIPVLTMRSMAEDRKNKTDQLLYSLPIGTSAVVIGKFLAMTAVYGIACLGMGFVPVILSLFGTVYFGSAYAALLGFFLLGTTLIAVCMYLSSVTESQIIAAVLGIGASFALYLMTGLASMLPTGKTASLVGFILVAVAVGVIVYILTKNYWIAFGSAMVCAVPSVIVYIVNGDLFESLFPKFISYLAVFDRFENFTSGIFDMTAVVYYLSVIVFFVFLSVQSMDKRRWN